MDKLTRGQRVNADISALLRARNTCLWITTREEMRVERALLVACGDARMAVYYWDCAAGVTTSVGAQVSDQRDPAAALAWFSSLPGRAVLVMRDLHKWFDPVTLRTVRNMARALQTSGTNEARALVVLTPSSDVPPEIAGCTTVIEYPLPDRQEIAALLDDVLNALPDGIRSAAAPNGTRDAAIDAAVGLTAEEATNCYAKSLVTSRKIDPKVVASEKRRVIARERVLTWYEPDNRGLDAIGGLDVLKQWLIARRRAFSPAARAFGLQAPKGAMLVGVPGCGKSLTAKAVAAAWGMPLLRLDMGALRSKFVGDSEANIRKALSVAEAVSPCVLWLDEIEKALAGATGAQGDGGVSADALGAVLSWMQEREGSVFVVATANDVRALPPELLRKGRFDELFFVDLPTMAERVEIVQASVRAAGRDPTTIDCVHVARACAQFTGSEIAALVPDALFVAFGEQRELATTDLIAAAATVVPLAKTANDKITQLREWANGRARLASLPEAIDNASARSLDLS